MSRPTVVITGAAARIGQAIAQTMAARGCDILLHYHRSAQAALNTARQIEQNYAVRCETVSADLAEQESAELIIDAAIEMFGRVDHLVNNASIFYPTSLASMELESSFLNSSELGAFERWFAVNCRTPWRLAEQARLAMTHTGASIINLIDIYADAGLSDHTAYVASKSALKAITHSLAREFAPKVRVNGISPGAILWPEQFLSSDKEQINRQIILDNTALKRLGSAQDIAATAAFLALDASYVTGNVINVDGGRKLYI